jgi:hypothetical protein
MACNWIWRSPCQLWFHGYACPCAISHRLIRRRDSAACHEVMHHRPWTSFECAECLFHISGLQRNRSRSLTSCCFRIKPPLCVVWFVGIREFRDLMGWSSVFELLRSRKQRFPVFAASQRHITSVRLIRYFYLDCCRNVILAPPSLGAHPIWPRRRSSFAQNTVYQGFLLYSKQVSLNFSGFFWQLRDDMLSQIATSYRTTFAQRLLLLTCLHYRQTIPLNFERLGSRSKTK